MTTQRLLGLACAAGLAAAPTASADFLYTALENTANGTWRLAKLDLQTHAVSLVGQLNYANPGFITEMAFHNGRLYAVDYDAFGGGTRLLAIDPTSAAVQSVVPITLDGANLNRRAALASVGGELVISYAAPGSASAQLYNTLARLSTTGAITDAVDYRGVAPEIGVRGLATAPDGRLLAMEHTFTHYLYLSLLGRDPASYERFVEEGAQPFFNAVEVFRGRVYLMDNVSNTVQVYDAHTGAGLGAWSYVTPFGAPTSALAIPAPGALALLAAAPLAFRRRR